MNPQDLNINLTFIDDSSSDDEQAKHKGQLKMQHNNGNVSLSFYPELNLDPSRSSQRKFAQIPDHVFQLSDFTMIEMDPADRLIVTLSGSRSHCQLYFQVEKDIAAFLDYIGQKVCLKHSDCNPCIFLLESLDSSSSSIAPFMGTVLPQASSHPAKTPTRVALQRIENHGLVYTCDSDVPKMSAEEYSALFDEEGRIRDDSGFPGIFFNVVVDQSVSGELWKLLLEHDDAKLTKAERLAKDEENRKLYHTVKEQWQSTTLKQWSNHPDLRALVGLLEKDLKAHPELFEQFSNPKQVQKIVFNIFLTLSIYNWDGASYVEGLVTFIAPFLDSFIKNVEGNIVTTPDGRDVSTEEVEADIFSVFSKFYELNQLCDLVRPSRQPFLKPLFIAIGGILEKIFPELLQLLYQKHAFSLDFLRDDCSKWFTTCFGLSDVRRLWISILSFPSTFQFFQCFIVSFLFSLAPEFVEMNPLNSEEFVRRFHTLKKKVGLNLLLKNTQKIRELTQKSVGSP